MSRPVVKDAIVLNSLHYLRGLAALSVLLFHASSLLRLETGDAAFATVFGPVFSYVAVAAFFAMSGFLMARLVERTTPAMFLIHRLVRIYPTYIIASLLAAWAFTLVGLPWTLTFRAMLLVPIEPYDGHSLGVEWTLAYEMAFYIAIFVLTFVGLRAKLSAIALVWLALVAVIAVLGFGSQRPDLVPAWDLFIAAPCAGFAGGLLASSAVRRLNPLWALVSLPAVLLPMPYLDKLLVAGLGAAAVVACLVHIETFTRASPLRRKILIPFHGLGTASYALYLVHLPTLRLFYHYAKWHISGGALWVAGVALCLAIGGAFGVVDTQIYKLLRARTKGLSAPVALATAVAASALWVAAALLPAIGLVR